jgi:pimeloyl-ACP methyl ester carboxylesterase
MSIVLFHETFGHPNHSPILLIMGAGSQGLLWTDDFCQELASRNFYVIRYDHRDTGLSTCVNYEEQPYGLNELARDALGLLDQLQISKAHVVGLSMGGYIVQLLAIYHPDRLLCATIIMSTLNHMILMNVLSGVGSSSSNLPPPKNEALTFFATPPGDMTSKEEVIRYSLATWKILNGTRAPFDEAYWRALVIKHNDRIKNHAAQYHHAQACLASPEDRGPLLRNVSVPTLVIHGSEDPMLPIEHGRALAAEIPGAKMVVIDGMGHALNPVFQHEIIDRITLLTQNCKRLPLLSQVL